MADGRAVVTVADNGVGIAPEDQQRVFERFYRVDKSRSKQTGGTGLGLSIVKHGAQVHHAQIAMQSALGEGTTITLTFPAQSSGKKITPPRHGFHRNRIDHRAVLLVQGGRLFFRQNDLNRRRIRRFKLQAHLRADG